MSSAPDALEALLPRTILASPPEKEFAPIDIALIEFAFADVPITITS